VKQGVVFTVRIGEGTLLLMSKGPRKEKVKENYTTYDRYDGGNDVKYASLCSVLRTTQYGSLERIAVKMN
jgi:hypothetical protein